MTTRLLSMLILWATTAVSVSALAAPPADARPADASGIIVDYEGRLHDEAGKPISGVFALVFKLYDEENAAKAVWSEKHYVAVVDGAYRVPLGTRRVLEEDAVPPTPWIGVELDGEAELLRDRLRVGGEDDKDSQAAGDAISAETRKLLEQARSNKDLAFADIAERAVQADRANVAKRAEALGDLSAEEIEDLANLALERLGDHIADPDAHQATGGIRVGDSRRELEPVGGTGGTRYERNCPPGHVVTGIRGGAGRLLDSITLICSPLR